MSTPETPKPPETDSVLELHRQHMAEMNDAAMSVDGTPPDEERDTVQGMLDVLWREHAEPRDGFSWRSKCATAGRLCPTSERDWRSVHVLSG